MSVVSGRHGWSRPTQVVAFAPFAVVGVVELVALLVSAPAVSDIAKPLLMPLLAVGLVWASPVRRSLMSVLGLCALLFSWLGDISPMDANQFGFLSALGFFLIAHVFYIVLFIGAIGVRRISWWIAIYVLWWIALLFLLGPAVGSLFIPVAGYGVVLGTMAAVATRSNAFVVTGGAVFLASDSLLGIDKFLPDAHIPQHDFLIMLTYIVGQGLIIWGLVVAQSRRVVGDGMSR